MFNVLLLQLLYYCHLLYNLYKELEQSVLWLLLCYSWQCLLHATDGKQYSLHQSLIGFGHRCHHQFFRTSLTINYLLTCNRNSPIIKRLGLPGRYARQKKDFTHRHQPHLLHSCFSLFLPQLDCLQRHEVLVCVLVSVRYTSLALPHFYHYMYTIRTITNTPMSSQTLR